MLTLAMSETPTSNSPISFLAGRERMVRIVDHEDYVELQADVTNNDRASTYLTVTTGYVIGAETRDVCTSAVPVCQLEAALAFVRGGTRG